MQPFLDARFTQGALDGGERGSGRGLGPLLDELIAYVKEVRALAVPERIGGRVMRRCRREIVTDESKQTF